MRKIETHDVFKMARIIKKAEIKGKIEEIIRETNRTDEQDKGSVKEKIGVKIMFCIIETCSDEKLEEMLYDLIGGITEKDANAIKTMSIEGLMDVFKEIAEANNLTNFFNIAGRLA